MNAGSKKRKSIINEQFDISGGRLSLRKKNWVEHRGYEKELDIGIRIVMVRT